MSDDSPSNRSTGRFLGIGLLGESHRVPGPDDGEDRVRKYLSEVELAETFEDAFETLARLDDPGLARYFRFENPDDAPPFIECEYIPGTDIFTWVRDVDVDSQAEHSDAPPEGLAEWSEPSSVETDADQRDASRASDRAIDVEGEDQSEDEAFETGAGEPEAAGRASDAASPDEATAYLDRAFSRIRDIVPQLITSLDRLHRFGHAHGDLRSSNIRISPDGRCALTDYGIVAHARFRDDSLRARPRYAVFDSYRAPEVREGAAPSPAADRYSLGCVLFELVTGCRPVRPDDADPNPLAGGALSELEPHCPAEWVDLVTRLLSRDPDERPSLESVDRAFREIRAQPVSIPPTFVPEGEAFHGRRDVLDELIETAEDCADRGELTATLVTGGPGYGKSAAVRALSQWASEHGWVVLTGECREPVARAWEPWRGVVRQLVDLLADSEEALRDRVDAPRRRAATLFPDVADGSVDRVSRIEAVRAVRELLGALASERPILLWFDDLQWADRDSLSLLADLMARPADLTCLAIGTWRGTAVDLDDHALGAELATAPVDVGRIEVPKLTADEAETFLDELAGGLRRELRRWVLANSGRNPLLIQELVYELHLRAPDAGEKRTALSELATSDEPGDALRRLIGSRLERLSRRESFVVQLMSVAGLPLSEEALVGALESEFRGGGPDEHIAGDLFHRLRRLRLIRETDSPDGGSSYRLFHDVCRRLVLEDTTDQRRRHLCGLLADVVSDLDADAPLLAFEYRRQADDDLEEHAAEAVRAARHAEDRRAYGRAADIWRWLVERPEAAERLTSAHPRRSLAEAERFAGRPAHAARHYRSTADAPPDGIERAVLRRDAFETLLESGERPDALDALEDALAHFSERYDAANVVTRFSEYKNRLVAATNRWADDLDAASTAAPGREAALRIDLYRFLVFNNDILASSRGARFRAKLSAIAETSGRALFLGWERLFRARSSHEGWRLERDRRAREWYDEAEQLFDRAECRTGATLLAVGRSDLHRKAGRFEEAEAVLDETPTSELGEADARRVSHLPALARARLAYDRADFDRAVELAREILHLRRHDAIASFRARRVLIPIYLLRADFDAAERAIDACSRFLRGPALPVARVWLVRQIVRWNLALGRPDVALGRIDVLDARLDRSPLGSSPDVRAMLELSRAQSLIAGLYRDRMIGRNSSSRSGGDVKFAFGRLRDTLDSLSPPQRAECHRTFARWELLRGRPSRAMEELDDAVSALHDFPGPLARTLCAEAMGAVQKSKSSEESPTLLEQSQILREHWGCPSPLALEGWPVPDELSALQPDDE